MDALSPLAAERHTSTHERAEDERAAYDARARGALRFITCGSVDDGKSTLIGRLLHEARAVFEDQQLTLAADSRRFGTTGDEIDYALLVDGLEAEREQGITIDVAYRFFSTPKRAFIVADTPGHVQYTRNMATGASSAELAVLLIDARQGVLEQTRRHAAIVSLLGVHHVVLAINKMDLVDYDQAVFNRIVADFETLAKSLHFTSVQAIPLAARYGDNVASLSPNTPWHRGPTLLSYLETIDASQGESPSPFRFPIQWVNRPHSDFRGLAGTIESGAVGLGDQIVVANSGKLAHIQRIATMDGDLSRAIKGQAVTLVLSEQVDAARGDILADPRHRPDVSRIFAADLVVMTSKDVVAGSRFLLKLGSRVVEARLTQIDSRIDIATFSRQPAQSLAMNDIARVRIETAAAIAFDAYADNRATGAFILIDPATNETAAAGMISASLGAKGVYAQDAEVDAVARTRAKNQAAMVIWLTGLSGAGKSTIAALTERRLHAEGYHTMMLDGDQLRLGLNSDLGFSPEARKENVRRVGEVARLMTQAGLIVFCALVSPFRADRAQVAAMFAEDEFCEIFVDAPLAACKERDVKGLYAKAETGGIADMTGMTQNYEPPDKPALVLRTSEKSAQDCADELFRFVYAIIRKSTPTSLDSAQL